jgi:hypothetical protein
MENCTGASNSEEEKGQGMWRASPDTPVWTKRPNRTTTTAPVKRRYRPPLPLAKGPYAWIVPKFRPKIH